MTHSQLQSRRVLNIPTNDLQPGHVYVKHPHLPDTADLNPVNEVPSRWMPWRDNTAANFEPGANDDRPAVVLREHREEHLEESGIENYLQFGRSINRQEFCTSIFENVSSTSRTGTSLWSGALIMANVCIGMGLLNFPRAVADAGGIVNSAIFLGVMVILIAISLLMIGHCCLYYGCVSYSDMVITHCGARFGILCQTCLLLETLGSCIVKLVAFGDQLHRCVEIFMGEHYKHTWFTDRRFLILIVSSVTILPLCMLKKFHIFKYTSFLGLLIAFYIAFGVTMTRFYTSNNFPGPIDPQVKHSELITFLPLLIYAFHGHIEAPVVLSCLKQQKISYFMKLVTIYITTAVLLYLVCGIYGFWTFGNWVHEDILLAYPSTDISANVGSFLIIMKLLSSFPIIFFILRAVVNQFWCQFLPTNCIANNNIRYYVQTVILYFLCLGISCLTKDIGKAIVFVGAISCNFAFTFPGLCMMFLYEHKENKTLKHWCFLISGVSFVVLGIFITGTNSCLAIQDILSGKTRHH